MSGKKKHFVTFYSPGTFVSEVTDKEIDSWSVRKAMKMAQDIKERYGATPYAFQFFTVKGKEQTDYSPKYFLGGKVENLQDVEARATKADEILLSNMRANGYELIITNTNSWKITTSLEAEDVVLQWPLK